MSACAFVLAGSKSRFWRVTSAGSSTRRFGMAQLHGVRAPVVARESLISDKSVIRSDATTAAKDRADVARLLHRT